MQRLKIPWLIDIVRVSSARDVQLLAGHPSLERNLERTGPLFNRLLLGRILSTFQAGGRPLPAFRGRADEEREAAQGKLQEKLDAELATSKFDELLLRPAVRFVSGEGDIDKAMAGICVVLARIFNPAAPDHAGSRLWRDARIVDAAVRPFSLTGWAYRLTGRNRSARMRILATVDEEPNGLHAVAITTANIRRTLKKMAQSHRLVAGGRTPSPETAASLWLRVRTAPSTLFRRTRATMSLPTSGHVVTPDALILLRARKAQQGEPPLGFAFMEDSWSKCPAAAFVRAMCWHIWTAAMAEGSAE